MNNVTLLSKKQLREIDLWLQYVNEGVLTPVGYNTASSSKDEVDNTRKTKKKKMKQTSQAQLALPMNTSAPNLREEGPEAYHFNLMKITGLRTPEYIRTHCNIEDMSFCTKLSFFHEGSKTLFGHTWQGESFGHTKDNNTLDATIIGNQDVLFRSPIRDETCYLIVELVLQIHQGNHPVRRIDVGWTFIPVFSLGESSMSTPLTTALYAGNPRDVLFVDTTIQWKKNLILASPSCIIYYQLNYCTNMLKPLFHLFRNHEFIGAYDKVCGVANSRISLPPSITMTTNLPMLSLSVDHPIIPIPKEFESNLLSSVAHMRKHDWPKRRTNARPSSHKVVGRLLNFASRLNLMSSVDASQEMDAYIKSRSLMIGIHNGRTYIRQPQSIINLEAREIEGNEMVQLVFEGMQHIRDIPCDVSNRDSLLALTMELQYTIEWPGKDRNTATITVGWCVHLFAANTLRFDGSRQEIQFMRECVCTPSGNVVSTISPKTMMALEVGLISSQYADVEEPRSPIHYNNVSTARVQRSPSPSPPGTPIIYNDRTLLTTQLSSTQQHPHRQQLQITPPTPKQVISTSTSPFFAKNTTTKPSSPMNNTHVPYPERVIRRNEEPLSSSVPSIQTDGMDLCLEINDPNKNIDFTINCIGFDHVDKPSKIMCTFSFFHLPYYHSNALSLKYPMMNNHNTTVIPSIINHSSFHCTIPPNEYYDFTLYLLEKTLYIDTWDADSLLYLGTSALKLSSCLRQGRTHLEKQFQTSIEKRNDYGGSFLACPKEINNDGLRLPVNPGVVIDLGHGGGGGAGGEYNQQQVLGTLQLNIIHASRAVDKHWKECLEQLEKKLLPSVWSASHLIRAQIDDYPCRVTLFKVGNPNKKSKPIVAKPLLSAEIRAKYRYGGRNSQQRRKPHQKGIRAPIIIPKQELQRDYTELEMEVARLEAIRDSKVPALIRAKARERKVRERVLQPQMGECIYFEVAFTNYSSFDQKFYVCIDDPAMKSIERETSLVYKRLQMNRNEYPMVEPEMYLVGDLDEYVQHCLRIGLIPPTSLPYNEDKQIKATQKLIEVKSKQTVFIPIKFQSFCDAVCECNGHGNLYMKNNNQQQQQHVIPVKPFPYIDMHGNDENQAPRVVMKERMIKVKFLNEKRKRVGRVEVTIKPKPPIIDRIYRYHHWSNRKCNFQISLNNNNNCTTNSSRCEYYKLPCTNDAQQIQTFQANVHIKENVQPIAFYCTNQGVHLQFKHNSNGIYQSNYNGNITNINNPPINGITSYDTIPTLNITCDTPSFPDVDHFYIFMYGDRYRGQLLKIMEIFIHSSQCISFNTPVGLHSIMNGIIQLPSTNSFVNVQCHSSRPNEYAFGQSSAFGYPSLKTSIDPRIVSNVSYQYRGLNLGMKMSLINLVDTDRLCLIASWLSLTETIKPHVDITYPAETLGIGTVTKIHLTFTNVYDRRKEFQISTSHPSIMEITTPRLSLEANDDTHIGFNIHGTNDPQTCDIYMFVEDESGERIQCYHFKYHFEPLRNFQ